MAFKKGQVPWNKGKKVSEYAKEKHWNWQGGKPKCIDCGKQLVAYGAQRCQKHANAILLGKYRYKGEAWNKGLKGFMAGEKNNFWKGGVTPINKSIRTSAEYKAWRTAIFERDNYTCVECEARSKEGARIYLQADHIKPFNLYPDLRFELSNGRTLCISCHKKTPSYLNRWYKEEENV